jgi:starch phosphorylase
VVNLGKLKPSDVVVQVYYGRINPHGDLENTNHKNLELVKSEDKIHYYEGYYECPDTGQQGFTVRVLPSNELMVNPAELYLCSWASVV